MRSHDDVVARRDGTAARVLAGAEQVDDAIALLDAAEAAAGTPLVDEAERERLHALATGVAERPDHWHSLLARHLDAADPVGYAGVVLPTGAGGEDAVATADVAVARDRGPCDPALAALLAGLEALAADHDAATLQVWIRHAVPDDLACAEGEGFVVDRRLGILGRSLHEDLPDTPPSGGVTIRPLRPDLDDPGVVEVLRAAYADTPEAGWDLAQFRERRGWSWFRAEDLLVAEDHDTGRIAGLHWLKRRSATVGEVYNLAVHPNAQGRGLGPALLVAGLRHLRDVGCDEVLLWVDLANERGVRLYGSQGFETRWEDVALIKRPSH